ncbi:hypothetical protein ABT336_19090 [Micromonospora sp. NPDC000207]|uniref:hypothetical protein n=1 Tax=Micromonospora sp. NPDC000207 TaxID=3154246 RepID=UPI00331BF51E
MGRIPRPLYWLTLVAMSGTLLVQVLSGFDQPLEIVSGCIAAVLVVWSTVALVAGRKSNDPK